MKKTLCIILALICMFACAAGVYAADNKGTASTIKLEQAEGTVTVTNSSGKDVSVRSEMRLYSGYTIQTGSGSSAYISLDSTKAVLLEASSKLTLKKSGSKIDLMLESGTILTDVAQKLDKNESINIHTTNMVTGIRGTGVEVKYDPDLSSTRINMLHGSSEIQLKIFGALPPHPEMDPEIEAANAAARAAEVNAAMAAAAAALNRLNAGSTVALKVIQPSVSLSAGQGVEVAAGVSIAPAPNNIVMRDLTHQTQQFVVVQQGASRRVTDGFNETFGVNDMTDEEKNELTDSIAAGVEEQNRQDEELDAAAQLYAEEAVSPSAITTDGAIVASGGAIVTTEGAIVDPVFEQQLEADTVGAVVVDIPEETTSVTVDEDDGEMTVQEPNPETSNTFTVTWMNYDGSILERDENVTYGSDPSYDGPEPEKAADAEYRYSFRGWDPEITSVTANTEYTADYDSSARSYGSPVWTWAWSVEGGYSDAVAAFTTNDDATEHTERIDASVATGGSEASCTAGGTTVYTATAIFLGEEYQDVKTVTVESLGHDLVHHEAQAATCGGIGWNAYDTCSRCDYTTYQEIPALGHDIVSHEAQAATCGGIGWDAYETCSRCDYTTYKEIAALGHSYGEPEWSWTGYTTASALFTCSHDTSHVETVNAEISRSDAADKYTYTATVSFNGQTYTDSKTETRTYTVTWKDYDGTVLASDSAAEYGSNPSYQGTSTPTREATAEYTYTFAGWDPAITEVTGDATYTATFSAVKNKYAISFVNGSETLQNTEVEYGATPSYSGETPTKADDEQYTYTFSGWSPEITAVTGEATYTAEFTSQLRAFNVNWQDYDTTVLGANTVKYGEDAVYPGSGDPTRPADAEYTYTFAGWTPEPKAVTSDITVKATYTAVKNKYTVKFLNDNGTEISSSLLEYGTTPQAPADIAKEATAEYTYTFTGWNPAIETVTKDANYTATFSAEKNKYNVTWIGADGKPISEEAFEYGSTPSFGGATPTKAATDEFTYTFAGWDPAITTVTGATTYTATFTEKKNSYTITWKNDEGSTIGTDTLEYGSTPTHAAISKASTAAFTYNFAGWTPSITTVTTNAAYTATFSAVVNTYTVTWKNEDGTILETDENVPYDTTPEYNGEVPAKEDDEQYTYAFLAWDKELTAVTGDVTYTATYESITRTYGVYWNDWDGSTLWISTGVPYGTVPEYPEGEVDGVSVPVPSRDADAQYTYTFNGWDPAPVAVTGAATYTATYSAVVNKYSVAFVDEDGSTVLKAAAQYDYGTAAADIAKPADPTKESTVDKVYTFTGWTPELADVTANATYAAVYSEAARTYTVTWKDHDGTVLASDSAVEYGSTPAYPGDAAPTREATAEYTYTFEGWDPEVTAVNGDAVYTATYSALKNRYTITWKNDTGSTIGTDTLEYGSTPTHAAIDKASTAAFTYTFAGWTPEITTVTTDAAYTATFSAVKNSYTVSFNSDGGPEVESQTVEYGSTATTPAALEMEGYIFDGWYEIDASEAFDFSTPIEGDVDLIAHWLKTVTVTFIYNDDATDPNEVVIVSGSAIEIPAVPTRDGYTFDFWFIPDQPNETAYDFETPVTGDIFLMAHWTPKTVTFSIPYITDSRIEDFYINPSVGNDFAQLNTSSTGTTFGAIVGDTVYLPLRPDGYTVTNWELARNDSAFSVEESPEETGYDYYITGFTDDVELMFDISVKMPVDETDIDAFLSTYYENGVRGLNSLTCQIPSSLTKPADNGIITYETYQTYTVTFDYGDGRQNTTVAVEYDSHVAKPEDPTREGYTFAGWYKGDAAYTFDFTNQYIREDTTLTAHWTGDPVTITAPYMTPQRSSMVLVSLTDGTNTQSSDQSDFSLSTTVGTPITLTVTNYDPYIVAVTPAAVGGLTVEPSGAAENTYTISGFTTDTALKFDIVVKMPFTNIQDQQDPAEFAYRYYDSSNTTGINTFTCQYPENLTPSGTSSNVVFEPYEVYLTVTFVDDEGSGVDPAEQQVRYNELVVKPADPTYSGNETNLSFLGWCSDSDRTMLYDFNSPVTEDLMLYAKWGVRTLNMHVPYMVSPDEDGMNVYPIGEDAQYTTRTSDDCSMSFTEGSEIPVKISFDPVYMSVTDVSVITSGGGVGISVEHSDIIIRDGQQMQYKNATISGITEDFDLLLDVTIKLLDGNDATSVIGSYFSNYNGIAHITALLPDSIDPSDVPEETDSLSVEFYKTPIDITVPTVPDGLGEQPIGIFLYSADGEMLEYGINTPNVYSTDTETLYVGIDVNRYIINNYTTGAGVVYAPNVTDAAVNFVAIGNDSIPEVIETNEDVKFFKTTDLSSDFTLGIDITITLDELGSEATPTTLYQSLALLALDGSAKSITIYYKEDDTAPASVEITLRNGISSALSSTGYDANGEAINKFSFEAY